MVALALALGIVTIGACLPSGALPASAGYVNPNSCRVQQSFQHGD